MGYAEHQFQLSAPQDDGLSLREHLMAAYRWSGRVHPMIAEGPELPDDLAHLWADFLDLHNARGSTGFGPAGITFADIHAWESVNRTRLAGWQLSAIRQADAAYLRGYAERSKRQ